MKAAAKTQTPKPVRRPSAARAVAVKDHTLVLHDQNRPCVRRVTV